MDVETGGGSVVQMMAAPPEKDEPATIVPSHSVTMTPETITEPSNGITNQPPRNVHHKRKLVTQPSTVAVRRQHAVCVRRARKVYGSKNNPNIVLDGLSMTVPKGTIYGLLGASGCGKTTLLSCIVGRRRLNSGEIWVLGGKPGSRGSGVPGPRIGYMPQEVALYGEFTIRETLLYFGWINDMSTDEVEDKIDGLLKMLQMPRSDCFVKNLSGGQQRRMSLAASLLHEPELLILDEPTVGVDPVLRQNIWDYLVDITRGGQKTVIITTHYIDETRQAHLIGLMRGGRFLAEESPSELLRQYNSESLEDVFLKLAVMQNMGKRRRSSIATEVIEQMRVTTAMSNPGLDLSPEDHGEISGEFGEVSIHQLDALPKKETAAPPLPPDDEPPMKFADYFKFLNAKHMHALLWKNFLWMSRNFGVMAFIIGLPVIQIILFCWAIGHDPTGLKISVANYELDSENVVQQFCPLTKGCNYTYLSCRYLEFLKVNKSMELTFYETEEGAYEQVRRGKAWGALVFASNYSESLVERTEAGQFAEDWTLETSDVSVKLDMSNQQIGTLLWRDLQYSFFDFIANILTDCDVNPSIGKIPIRWNDPVYGDKTPNFTDFAAPGVILTIIFFLSVALTSGAMIIEKNEGIMERCLVSGITGTEIMFSHVTTQFIVMVFQTILVLLFSFAIFGLTIHGQMWTVVLLTIMTGLCGMCFGFVISTLVDNERNATYLAMGSFLPIVMLCGIIWPIEGMHWLPRYFTKFLPLTLSTESLRSILQRGWLIDNPNVYSGFISTSIWISIFMISSLFLLKFKKG